jgi:hypothetical protein
VDKRGKVTEADDGTWQFRCWASNVPGDPRVVGSPADPGACGYLLTKAPTRKAATARGDEHLAEHDGEAPVELADSKAHA